MSQYQVAMLLVVLAGARTGDCRGRHRPEGLCAFGHLEPARIELHVGSTLQIRVNGSTCSGRDCVDCGSSVRLRWRSTVPDVASVNSTGLVRARRARNRSDSARADRWWNGLLIQHAGRGPPFGRD